MLRSKLKIKKILLIQFNKQREIVRNNFYFIMSAEINNIEILSAPIECSVYKVSQAQRYRTLNIK